MLKIKPSLLALLVLPSLGVAEVRIGLFQKELPDHFWVSSAGGLRVVNASDGKTLLTLPGDRQVALQKIESRVQLATADSTVGVFDTVQIEPVQPADALIIGTERIEKRPYHGRLEIKAAARELLAINIVSENDYLNAVVADEMPSSWPLEALKAQAVVARTFMLKNKGRHHADGYDFCDLAHCQVYQGASKGNSKVRDAVAQTADEVLTYKGALIEAFFHSTCGGHTASNEDVWPGPALPYLRGRPDSDVFQDFCRSSPDYQWTVEMNKQDMTEMLRPLFEGSSDPGVLQSLDVKSTDPSGRVKEIDVRFTNDHKLISGYKLYLIWGRSSRWHQLKSTWFQIISSGNGYEFRGKGLGHGIGFCQWGANGQAAKGATYRAILAHYFTGTAIEKRN